MRVALIADMHGNAVAFDAVLRELELERFDAVVSLGDVAQGGPQPAECIDRLRELGCRCVLGNSDEFLLTLELGSEEVDDERREQLVTVGRWSQQQLGDEQLAFLQAFEPTVELDVGGRRLVCCHGSPASNEEVVLPETPREKVEELIGRADAVAGGHVHLQWLRRAGRGIWFCAGSVGLVYEHKEPMDERPFDPWAEYAVLTADDGKLGVEFRRVPFDVGALIRAAEAMPDEQYAAMWKRA
ncbi:MAG: metallophosphoesterase family protein [Actinobacteria bacterium]|nr:MAG: metallophosphoesterase family protein [Actinomycetota bacterium]